MNCQETVLKLQGISKRFKGIIALENAEFEVQSGEIHTLLGENGAGKSTILNIMSGAFKADSGEIIFKGDVTEIDSPRTALNLGIIKVHQEIQTIQEMTVFENIFLGSEIITKGLGFVKRSSMRKKAKELLDELSADFSPDDYIGRLSIAQQQIVEIAKALLHEFSVLILDEPTSSLTTKEIHKLFAIMKKLKQEGKAIIFVSHRLDEVFKISDRITVFKDGHYVGTKNVQDVTRNDLLKMMTGRDIRFNVKKEAEYKSNEIVLEVKNLTGINKKFRNVSFDLHKGEILGFAGLVGAGRSETMRAIFGADKLASGEIYVSGKKVNIRCEKDAIEHGIALVPEDRKKQGMIGILTNAMNIGLGSFDKFSHKQILTNRRINNNAKGFMEMLHVKPMNPQMYTENLSGGNQQKIVIAKWLSLGANILIMDEPTRGIDVGAKEEIYTLMNKLTQEGVSIIMISSELPEILSMCDRVLVMHEGVITGELEHKEMKEESILHLAMGGK